MTLLELGFELMAYGLGGVFLVLALFIGMINVLTRVFPEKEIPVDLPD